MTSEVLEFVRAAQIHAGANSDSDDHDLKITVVAAMNWMNKWRAEQMAEGLCVCAVCFADMIDEVSGEVSA